MITIIMILTRYETAVLGRPAKPVSYPAHIAGAVAGDDDEGDGDCDDDDDNEDDGDGVGDGDDDDDNDENSQDYLLE